MYRSIAVVSRVAVFVGLVTFFFFLFLLSACQTANQRAVALSACLRLTWVLQIAVQNQNSVRPFCQNHVDDANLSSDLFSPLNLGSSSCESCSNKENAF